MNSNKHTELPWTHKPCVSGGKLLIRPTKIQGSLQIVPSEDAVFIVKACNNHYQLLENLQMVERFLTQVDPVHWPSRSEARRVISNVREAIKQTEADNHD